MNNRYRTIGKHLTEAIKAYEQVMDVCTESARDEAHRVASYAMEIALELNEYPELKDVLIIAKNLFIQKADEKEEDLC